MITVENLRKQFGANEVLKDISTTIREQEVVCVIGPSGSGKSTFLRCLNLLEEVTSGKVLIGEVEVTSRRPISTSFAPMWAWYFNSSICFRILACWRISCWPQAYQEVEQGRK